MRIEKILSEDDLSKTQNWQLEFVNRVDEAGINLSQNVVLSDQKYVELCEIISNSSGYTHLKQKVDGHAPLPINYMDKDSVMSFANKNYVQGLRIIERLDELDL